MRWMTVCIAACLLLTTRTAVAVGGGIPWSDTWCVDCHAGMDEVLSGPMATRAGEREFACRAFGSDGDDFFDGSCAGCHLTTCGDCHGERPHLTGRPRDDACLQCHRDYFVGAEFHGRAPREYHERYQRGPTAAGQYYLKMLPDLHQEAGLGCVDCHQVHTTASGEKHGRGSVKTCRDCHVNVSLAVPEHAIKGHLDKMECWACHAAWGAQEYGSYLVHPVTEQQQEAFAPLPDQGSWKRSAVLKSQDAPPLGLDERGLVSPIRPQFILLATDPDRGWENKLLTAEWRAFFPHTIRRGTVTCDGCHENSRRFLLEKDDERIFLLEKDGLSLRSWWNPDGQKVVNGSFFPRERFDRMNRRTPEYVRQYLRQWKNILQHGADSSGP